LLKLHITGAFESSLVALAVLDIGITGGSGFDDATGIVLVGVGKLGNCVDDVGAIAIEGEGEVPGIGLDGVATMPGLAVDGFGGG